MYCPPKSTTATKGLKSEGDNALLEQDEKLLFEDVMHSIFGHENSETAL